MNRTLNDPTRLASLESLGLMDTPADPVFDRFTRMVAKLLDVPVALISLVDNERQFFKSAIGLPSPWDRLRQTPLSHSFCQHCVTRGDTLIINDASTHPLVRENLAISELGVQSYLGIPIFVDGQQCVGSLCAIDVETRGWSEPDVQTMRDVCCMLEAELQLIHRLESVNELSRRKSDFMAELGHELRNPLMPILGASQLLVNGDVAEAEKPEVYRVIQQQSEQLTRLIDELLDLSRIEQGKIELNCQRCDLVAIVERSIESVSGVCEEKSHDLQTSLGSDPIWISADESRMIQVVTNLLTNACRYTDAHGIIEVAVTSSDVGARLVIRDNGIGLTENELTNVFNLFQQGLPGRSHHQGLGIGLALVKRLVDLHDGEVTLESPGINAGCRVALKLPLAAPETIAWTDCPSEESAGSMQALDVLVVDDQRANVYVLEKLFVSEGCKVRTAANVRDAWKHIDSATPMIVFSDIQMPEVDGFEFARQLRANHRTSHLTLVAVTGEASAREIDAATEAGFNLHLSKPVSIQALRRALAACRALLETPVR